MATKPWSVINDDELKLLRQLADKAIELERGCDCDYDYRCRSCSKLISVKYLAKSAVELR
jgi:hypothetical protein